MYSFPQQINTTNMFLINKDLITRDNSIWAGLPLSTKSIYPVIGCFANEKGEAFPAQQTIADLTGLTAKTVREGIKGLLLMPNVNIGTKISNRGLRQKTYKITPTKGQHISFYKSLLESGFWRQLYKEYSCGPVHAVYITCLAYAFFDYGLYEELEHDIEPESEFFPEGYKTRKYDFHVAELDVIAEKSGVSLNSARKAINALIDCGLMDLVSEDYYETKLYKIYNKPVWDDEEGNRQLYSYKREFLNKALKKTQPKQTDFSKLITGSYDALLN